MKTRAVLIFSGYNNRAIIAFCRYALQKRISFFIVTKGTNDPINKTDYIDNVIFNREDETLSLEDVLLYAEQVKRESKKEEVFILPSTEYLNRFLLDFKAILNKNGVEIGLCKKQVYELVSDKQSFGELCKSFNIRTPETIDKHDDVYPIVIKPKTYFDRDKKINKPEVINSKENLEYFFKDKREDDFYLQEFVPGKSIYLLYYIFSNGSYAVFSQENYIQQYNGGSMILAKSSTYHNKNIATQFSNLFIKVGFSGLVMVELKLHSNEFYMIEANPRLWGPSQLIIDAGMDLFECFAYDNKLIEKIEKKTYIPNTWYFWEGGMINNITNDLPHMYHNFNQIDFISNKIEFEKFEVYNRKDTSCIYELENKLK
jgi:predicted ATP-grasp superfamily ATP-dependent carboligase